MSDENPSVTAEWRSELPTPVRELVGIEPGETVRWTAADDGVVRVEPVDESSGTDSTDAPCEATDDPSGFTGLDPHDDGGEPFDSVVAADYTEET